MTTWLPVALAALAAAVAVDATRPAPRRLAGLRGSGAETRSMPVSPLLAVPTGALLVAGPLAAALSLAAVVSARRALLGRELAAARQRERASALDALALLGADLTAGRSPADALAAAAEVATGPAAHALAAAASAAALGGDVARALVTEGSAVPGMLRGLAACWQVCAESGSGLAAAVQRLEEGLRAAEVQRRAVDAELAGPRATAGLLAVLPLAGIALSAALGAHPVHVLLHTPLGGGCLLGGLALDAVGLAWTRRLVGAATP